MTARRSTGWKAREKKCFRCADSHGFGSFGLRKDNASTN